MSTCGGYELIGGAIKSTISSSSKETKVPCCSWCCEVDILKANICSSNLTCLLTITVFLSRSNNLYAFWLGGYPKNTHIREITPSLSQ